MLTVLARAPVKVSATEALGTFRKTQEGKSRLSLRGRLVWDAVREAAVQSSYFACLVVGSDGAVPCWQSFQCVMTPKRA